MIRKNQDKIHWLQFQSLTKQDFIRHGVLLRQGGYSKGSYKSLNFGGGDNRGDVLRNFEKMKRTFHLQNIVWPHLKHSDIIKVATKQNCYESFVCDGVVTNEKNIAIAITHADCQCAFFYDPKKQVIAGVHAGWRGNVQDIYGKCIQKMRGEYGCDANDIIACISPSLGPNASQFINAKQELPEKFFAFQHKKQYFDLWKIAEKQLLETGITKNHIEIAGICTFENEQDFFSYRRDKVTGRHVSFIVLNS